MSPLLDVKNLSVFFKTGTGVFKVLNDVSLSIRKGELFALVGESGSGKSITSLAVMDLLPNNFSVGEGSIFFDSLDISAIPPSSRRLLKGGKMGMVFQDPLTALNPLMTIGNQIAENIVFHKKVSPAEALNTAAGLLSKVGIADGASRINDYPHQLSGGMRQRVMIAIAISCSPSLLIADEPTTALDVTVQASVMRLIKELCESEKMALLLISHNLALVKQYCSSTAVMYAGMIQETGPSGAVFSSPLHPYTKGLISCLPSMSASGKIDSIPGQPPSVFFKPQGCLFHPRCSRKMPECETHVPEMRSVGGAHSVRCHLYAK